MAMNQTNRQYPMTAVFVINKDDFGTGTEMVVGYLPDNSIITQAFIEGVEGYSASALTTAVSNSSIAIADLASGATSRTDATALGITTARAEVKVTRSATTDTTGKAVLVIAYVQAGRANEVQP